MASSAVALAHRNDPVAIDAPFIVAEAWALPKAHSPDPSTPHAQAPKLDLHKPLHVPGSTRTYTLAQYTDFNPPDWFPQDHPPMPQVVAHGRDPKVMACAECHWPNGQGEPATATLAGLHQAYMLEQIHAFQAGERGAHSGGAIREMAEVARNARAADLQQATAYFSKLKFTPNLRVVETATVPKTHWQFWVMAPDADGAREPIGERIIEVPVNADLYLLRDTHSGFVAYVPPGSIERGKALATRGQGAALPCESCHGANLRGVGACPPLAGRSPVYIARELILFRLGKRTDPGAAPMRLEVSHLTLKDMIDVAAYAGSRSP
ncbi:MAG: c-type cytochrome [Rhodanobacteraceae bacterium]